MADEIPTVEARKRALDKNMQGWRDHVEKQGALPSHAEIEKLHKGLAEKIDREKGW